MKLLATKIHTMTFHNVGWAHMFVKTNLEKYRTFAWYRFVINWRQLDPKRHNAWRFARSSPLTLPEESVKLSSFDVLTLYIHNILHHIRLSCQPHWVSCMCVCVLYKVAKNVHQLIRLQQWWPVIYLASRVFDNWVRAMSRSTSYPKTYFAQVCSV